MNCEQMIEDLKAKFPTHVKAVEAWLDGYRQVVGRGGLDFHDAYRQGMIRWRRPTPPKPADILGFLPKKAGGAAGDSFDAFIAQYRKDWEYVRDPLQSPYMQARRRVWKGAGKPPFWFKGECIS